MNPTVSFRLDALRACAALMVFFCHLSQLGYAGQALPAEVGRIGVLIFFVMSGYVIAFVTEHKHRNFRNYTYARFARLYSVLLAALVLTVLCDAIGRQLNTNFYASYPDVYESKIWLRLPFFLVFLFENSLLSLRWFSNGPIWSVAYEFWYYVLYGILAYTRGRSRIILTTIVLLLTGWKILLLAPVWFSGVLLYRHRQRVISELGRYRSLLLWLAIFLIVALHMPAMRIFVEPLVDWGSRQVGTGWHMFFLRDFLYALPVLLLVAMLIVPPPEVPQRTIGRKVVLLAANCSFSIYLYHVPLVLLFRASGLYNPQSLPQSMLAGLLTLASCFLLATVTEHRKNAWLKYIETVGTWLVPHHERIRPNV